MLKAQRQTLGNTLAGREPKWSVMQMGASPEALFQVQRTARMEVWRAIRTWATATTERTKLKKLRKGLPSSSGGNGDTSPGHLCSGEKKNRRNKSLEGVTATPGGCILSFEARNPQCSNLGFNCLDL